MAGEVFRWIEPDGAEHVLDGREGVYVNYGRSGRFMPPVAVTTSPYPMGAGSALQSVRVEERLVDLPLVIGANDPATLRSRLRALMQWCDPTRGDSRLRCTAPDGEQRELVCRLHEEIAIIEERILLGNVQRAVLPLLATDPYWQSVNESSAIFLLNNTTATFFPLFPLRLTSSTIFADTTVTNNGDAEAWPTWVIWGPGDAPVITNLTTGKRLSLGLTLGPGETLTIDTRPGVKTVTGSDGANHFPDLSTDSSLFSLPKGNSAVRVELGSADINSQVTLRFRERWLSP